jgi:hypothetical protein
MLSTMMTALVQRVARRRSGLVAGSMLSALLLLTLAACNDAPPTTVALNQLKWCDKQTMIFQDASQSPATPISDWKQVKKALDFTVYLPPQLPVGTCLVSGEALVHDKVLGSSFGVSYVLPGGVSLAFSETEQSSGETASFQCSPSNGPQPTATPTQAADDTPTPSDETTPTPTPPAPTATATNTVMLLCLGGKGKTSIVMGSSASEKDLKGYFQNMQADVDWIPQK